MKINKESRKLSRHLYKNSFTNGRLDQQKVSQMVQTVLNDKPRHLVGVLKNFQRLVRLEEEKRHAIIESASPLNRDLGQEVVNNLKARYGADVTTEFRTNPELLSGLRIRIGNDVFDGSVRNRLNELQKQL